MRASTNLMIHFHSGSLRVHNRSLQRQPLHATKPSSSRLPLVLEVESKADNRSTIAADERIGYCNHAKYKKRKQPSDAL